MPDTDMSRKELTGAIGSLHPLTGDYWTRTKGPDRRANVGLTRKIFGALLVASDGLKDYKHMLVQSFSNSLTKINQN